MLHLQPSTILFQVLNFLILLVLLARFFYRPVLLAMRKRQEEINVRLRNADERGRAAEELRMQLVQERSQAQASIQALLLATRQQATAEREQLLAASRADAGRLTDEAQREIAEKERQALERVQAQARASALSIAAGLIRQAAGPAVHHELVEQFLTHGTPSATPGDTRPAASRNGAKIHVSVAYPLSAEQEARLRDLLATGLGFGQAGRNAPIDVDSTLVAGLCITGAAFVLDFSLRHTLQELEGSAAADTGAP